MKLKINENRYLLEDITAVKKYYPRIDDDTFMQLIALDPTYRDGSNSLGKYGKWILNLYNKGSISEEDFSEIHQLLQQFTTYRNRIQNKDLNAYKSLQDLSDTLAAVVDDDSMLSQRQKVRFLKNVKAGRVQVSAEDDYDVVLETPKFIVYVPNTHEASMKLGKGTQWCTAHENPEWFNGYTSDGENRYNLYIIENKLTGERWQYSDGTGDFLDENDKRFNIMELMRQDKQLSKFFEQFLGLDYYAFDGTFTYTGAQIPDSIRKLITRIIVSDGVGAIKAFAFAECVKLNSVEIPDSVSCIMSYAFSGCDSLVSVNLPNGVKELQTYAFSACQNLESIKVPNSVYRVGEEAFRKCGNLTIYTDNRYMIDYCKEYSIQVRSAKEFKNESMRKPFLKLKLRIEEK